ncbi:MAG: LemA family protein [Gemmatimonadetes bacterium]|nr:LemA family protein [Gemmatimonadota bacterium]
MVTAYNRLVRLKNNVRNAFAQIDVQLKRRYDLIPNLVETARGYMAHERDTLEAVTRARAAAVTAEQRAAGNPVDAAAIVGLVGAEQALAGTLTRFFALVEKYPELKANQNMLLLQEELTSTENRVAFARQAYNDAVMFYNTATETFPSNLVARWFMFRRAEFWELSAAAERQAPRVSFAG